MTVLHERETETSAGPGITSTAVENGADHLRNNPLQAQTAGNSASSTAVDEQDSRREQIQIQIQPQSVSLVSSLQNGTNTNFVTTEGGSPTNAMTTPSTINRVTDNGEDTTDMVRHWMASPFAVGLTHATWRDELVLPLQQHHQQQRLYVVVHFYK
jgi:hypothetical protein